jgi:uncharacterized repeat protein (TIGR02543 family)
MKINSNCINNCKIFKELFYKISSLFLISILLLIHSSVTNASATLLQPNGWNSTNLNLGDDAFSERSFSTAFPHGIFLGNTNYSSLFVGSNGYITFGQGFTGFSSQGMNTFTPNPMIAAQYSDLHPGIGGAVYYYQGADYILVTYWQVPEFGGSSSVHNTMQIKLSRASTYSSQNPGDIVIELRYISLNWNRTGDTAGWTLGDQTTYAFTEHQGTAFRSNATASNVGTPGVFRWDVQGGVVKSTPNVTSSAATSITSISATLNGSITFDGNDAIIERGFVWSTSTNPTIASNLGRIVSTSGSPFNSTITGLNSSTTYHFRAYATNSVGTSYGLNLTFTTLAVSVIFNGNGGSNPNTISQQIGTSFMLPTSNRTGYQLNGWFDSITSGNLVGVAGASYTMPSTNTTLYAQWTANNYNVVFHANNGIGSLANQSIAYDSSAPLTLNSGAFTRDGYSFNGWNTQANGQGIAYAEGATITMNTLGLTLYAQWLDITPPLITVEGFTMNASDATSFLPNNPTIVDNEGVVTSGISYKTMSNESLTLEQARAELEAARSVFVVYTAVDAAGNVATETIQIDVVDDILPTISGLHPLTINASQALSFTFPEPILLDNTSIEPVVSFLFFEADGVTPIDSEALAREAMLSKSTRCYKVHCYRPSG